METKIASCQSDPAIIAAIIAAIKEYTKNRQED